MTLQKPEPYIIDYLSYHKENEKKSKRKIVSENCSVKELEGYETQILIGRILYSVIAIFVLFFTKSFLSIPFFIGIIAAYRLSVIRLFGMTYLAIALNKAGITLDQWYFLVGLFIITFFGIFGKPAEGFDIHYCERTKYIINTEALVLAFYNSQLYLSEVDKFLRNSEHRFYYCRLPEDIRKQYEFLINQALGFRFDVKNNYCADTIFYSGKAKKKMIQTWNEYADCFIKLTNLLQDIEHVINKMESDAASRAKNRQYNNKTAQNQNQSNVTTNTSNQSLHTMVKEQMFLGCTTKEAIEERYKKLMKTFHPDMQNGNEDLSKIINEVKEQLIKEI